MRTILYLFTGLFAALVIRSTIRRRDRAEFRIWTKYIDVGVVFAAGKQSDSTVNMWAFAVGITVVDYLEGWPRFWTFDIDAT